MLCEHVPKAYDSQFVHFCLSVCLHVCMFMPWYASVVPLKLWCTMCNTAFATAGKGSPCYRMYNWISREQVARGLLHHGLGSFGVPPQLQLGRLGLATLTGVVGVTKFSSLLSMPPKLELSLRPLVLLSPSLVQQPSLPWRETSQVWEVKFLLPLQQW